MAASNSISLSLTATYAPSWKEWEGVREFIQNWHDGCLSTTSRLAPGSKTFDVSHTGPFEFKAIVSVDSNGAACLDCGCLSYIPEKRRLVLVNKEVGLGRQVLLLGYSSKAAHKDVIGHFGEGMKVGALALLRLGHRVSMHTRGEVWRFTLSIDPHFGERVLTVTVEAACEGAPASGDTITTIEGVGEEDYRTYVRRFLFLQRPDDVFRCEIGSLIIDDAYRGQLYVKGIWINSLSDQGLYTGVDFFHLDLDRDRNATVRRSDMEHQVSAMWIRAVSARSDLVPRYWSLLNTSDCADVRYADFYADDDMASAMAAHFSSAHPGMLPIANSTRGEELRRLQAALNGEVFLCNERVLEILLASGQFETAANVLNRPAQVEKIPFASLASRHADTLKHAAALVRRAAPAFSLDVVDVVKRQEGGANVAVADGRIEVPEDMLCTVGMHLCQRPEDQRSWEAQPCLCLEVALAFALLAVAEPGGLAPLKIATSLASEVCGHVPAFCAEYHESARMEGEESILRKDCAARERELHRTIEELKGSVHAQEAERGATLAKMQRDMSTLEKQYSRAEIEEVNRSHQMHEQMKERTASLEAAHDLALEKQRLQLAELQREVAFLQRQRAADEDALNSQRHVTARMEEVHARELEEYRALTSIAASSRDGGELAAKLGALQSVVQERNQCIICFDRQKSVLLLPCRHRQLCSGCAVQMEACPLCRTPVESRLEVFD